MMERAGLRCLCKTMLTWWCQRIQSRPLCRNWPISMLTWSELRLSQSSHITCRREPRGFQDGFIKTNNIVGSLSFIKPFQSDKYVNKEGPQNGMSSQVRQMGSPSCLLWVSFCLINSAQLRCFCWICWVPISTALAGLTVAVSAWLGEDSFFPWCAFTHGVLHEEDLAHQMALVQKTAATHEILP